MATYDVSDGEILEGLSEISSAEDDYFENLKKLTNRKLELELENTIVFEQIAGYGKENHHSNRRPSKRKRLKSISRYETTSRDVQRSRAYRSTSIFSSYSIKKRKKARSSFRKSKRPKQQFVESQLREEDSERVVELDESSDEELLELRLNALKSKQEVKELINEEKEALNAKPVQLKPSEEEDLRILALRSAVLKKKEFYKERKKQKMMENERPYSPSDDLPPLALDEMVLSPLGSPFNEVQQEIDMDISNSPINEERDLSDMDTAPSPGGGAERDEGLEDSIGIDARAARSDDENRIQIDSNDEEDALRSLLLTSINNRKKNTSSPTPEQPTGEYTETERMAHNLLLAVHRLNQKKLVPTKTVKKSGNKTIAMILEESKNKKKRKLEEKQGHPQDVTVKDVTEVSAPREDSPVDANAMNESFLIRTITNDFMIPEQSKASTLEVPQPVQDTSFSTITDTKNIPILPAKAKQSRLITSIESVIKPVPRLVITLGPNSDTDEENEAHFQEKKTTKKLIQAPHSKTNVEPGFEKNLESFLKKIRLQQEVKRTEASPSLQPASVPATQPVKLTKVSSSVMHLPLSSQIEYEQLLQKMKVLEAAKLKRLKARQLKRTKSNSLSADKHLESATKPKPPTPKKASTVAQADAARAKSLDKISDSLRKIPQLDKSAQERLIEKAEINFKNHSNNLFGATGENIKLLEDNEADMKKQERLHTHIADLELLLQKYKSNLTAVDQRVKVNIHKIVQSQRSMITLRTRQRNFEKICQQVGTLIRGKAYSLPKHLSTEVEDNLTKIVDKTENILKATKDQKVKDYLRLIADRVKSLAVPSAQPKVVSSPLLPIVNTEPSAKEITEIVAEAPEADHSVTVEDTEEESEVMKMLRENSESTSTPEETNQEDTDPLEFPQIQRPAAKGRVLGGGSGVSNSDSSIVVKKLKYESPLEFLRLPKSNKYEDT